MEAARLFPSIVCVSSKPTAWPDRFLSSCDCCGSSDFMKKTSPGTPGALRKPKPLPVLNDLIIPFMRLPVDIVGTGPLFCFFTEVTEAASHGHGATLHPLVEA